MKIILSRKGFDSEFGGHPSPILSDGTLLSLPIPDENTATNYKDLIVGSGLTYFDIMTSLIKSIKYSKRRINITDDICCHLDPDIKYDIIERSDGWKGSFGQANQADIHLANQGVEIGDIFLFFGWFRKTKYINNNICFDSKDKYGRHIIFGYLQIGEIIKVDLNTESPKWLEKHPHMINRGKGISNTIYIANDRLTWNNCLNGFGTCKYDPSLVLTKENYSKSKWDLPAFFRNAEISRHKKTDWKDDYFQSVALGQDFVIKEDNEVLNWVKELIEKNV